MSPQLNPNNNKREEDEEEDAAAAAAALRLLSRRPAVGWLSPLPGRAGPLCISTPIRGWGRHTMTCTKALLQGSPAWPGPKASCGLRKRSCWPPWWQVAAGPGLRQGQGGHFGNTVSIILHLDSEGSAPSRCCRDPRKWDDPAWPSTAGPRSLPGTHCHLGPLSGTHTA